MGGGLIRSEGLLPTISALRFINGEIRRGGTLTNITNNSRLNPVISHALARLLFGQWNDCLNNSIIINRYFKWYILGLILTKSSSIIYLLLRFFIGLILASLGILFSPTPPPLPSRLRRGGSGALGGGGLVKLAFFRNSS